MRRLLLALAAVLAMSGAGGAAAAERTVVADLSERLIAIDTAFTGARVVLFGTLAGPGEVVVVAEGPRQAQAVQRKARVAGVWLTVETATFDAPAYYAVAGSGPLERIAARPVREQHDIGLDALELPLAGPDPGLTPARRRAFRQGLLRNKQRQELYSRAPGRVRFLGGRLFRADLVFPANVPPGVYRVVAYHLRGRQIVGSRAATLRVGKVGFEATLYGLAVGRPWLYGGVAVVIAVVSGYLAGVIFRRD